MTRVGRGRDVLWRRSGRRIVILPPTSQQPMVLDGVGGLVWELLDEPLDLADLAERLGAHFDMDQEMVERELRPFLAELADCRAITVGDDLAHDTWRGDR